MPTRSHQRPASCSAVTSTRRTWPRWRSATRPAQKAASTRRLLPGPAPTLKARTDRVQGRATFTSTALAHPADGALRRRARSDRSLASPAGADVRQSGGMGAVGRPTAIADHRACTPRRRGDRSDFRAPARVRAWPPSRRAAARCKQREPVHSLVLARPRSNDRQQYPARRTSPTSPPG